MDIHASYKLTDNNSSLFFGVDDDVFMIKIIIIIIITFTIYYSTYAKFVFIKFLKIKSSG